MASKKKRRGCLANIGIGIAVVFVLAFIGSLLGDDTETPSETTTQPVAQAEPTPEPSEDVVTTPSGTIGKAEAEVTCERRVKESLVSPGSAKFVGPFNSEFQEPIKTGNAWLYIVKVDSQNSFGALLRSRWRCTINGDADTISIEQIDG